MSEQDIRRVLVVGGGVMGSGIAQVVAGAGFDVTMVEISDQALTGAIARVEKGLSRLVKASAITEAEAAAARARIDGGTDLEAAAELADHVVETVVEDLAVKEEVLGRLDQACRPEVVFASNTSQFSISRLAAATRRQDRVIGSHWFNPPPAMDLIEIVRGVQTSQSTLELALELARRYGKQTILCQKDTQGFITSRLIAILMLEAMRIVEEGVASAEDVNRACVLAFKHAMGPLDTADFSGLDTTLKVAEAMSVHFGERFLPPQNLRTLVSAERLGRKSGQGFRDYGNDS